MIFKTSLQRAFGEMERMLVKNIAHSLFDIEFHRHASEEELMLYYGAGVDREAMITDTRRKLDGDQRLLRFYQSHKDIFNAYGKEDPTGDLGGAEERHAVETAGSPGHLTSPDQSSGEGPDASREGSDGHADDATEAGADRGNGAEEHGGGGELDRATGSNRRAHSEGRDEDRPAGSRETVRIALPTESEARRLELKRIEEEEGVIVKQDGDEVVVIPYIKPTE